MSRTLLLLLLVMAGLLTSRSVHADDEEEHLRWPTAADVHLDIEFVSGSIEIEGWDRNEVRVRARTSQDLDIEASHERISIGVPAAGSSWLVFGSNAHADLRIDVPRGSRIRAKLVNGPIRVKDVDGTLSLHSANGQLEVQGAPREARLESVSGSIEFEGKGSRVDARTISGSIELEGVGEEVIASTMSGSIQVEGDTLEHVDLRTLSGSIELAASLAADARVALKTYSGSIDLELPEGTSGHFDLQSFSGELRSELGGGHTRSRRRGPGRHLDFQAGDGAAQIRVETFSGSVRIEASD